MAPRHKKKEDLLSLVKHERNERVKELKCLYLLANELEKARTMNDLMARCPSYIRDAMQFPALCSVAIEIDGEEYLESGQSQLIIASIREEITTQGRKRGLIIINYHGIEPFLKEEYALASSIAKILGRAVERFEFEKSREVYMQKLELLVEDRLAELKKSRARYKSLYDNAPVGICISTREGDIVSANREFHRMFKYTENGPGQPHVLKDGLYRNDSDRDRVLECLENEGFIADFEVDMLARDGSLISVSLSAIRYEEDGRALYEAILKDITNQKNLEETLKKQKEELKEQVKNRTRALVRQRDKLLATNRMCQATSMELRGSVSKMQTLFDAITDPVLSIDRDFAIQMTNQKDVPPESRCHRLLFESDERCLKCPAVIAMKRKKPASLEVRKGERSFLLQCYPIIGMHGQVDGVIEWAKDVTEEKDIHHQMLQADRLASLGQLVSGIGHEINNPNTFILGNMKIIREAFHDIMPIIDEYNGRHPDFRIARLDYPFFREHIQVLMEDMVNGALRIKTIVEDLKKFARKNEEKSTDDVSVNQLVESSIRLVQNQVKRKANITTLLDDSLPVISANGIGLEQVLVNLLINASDAVSEGIRGGIQISTALDESRENIVISVSDNGCGMDEMTMKQIFNPFFTTKRARGGTGLGLSISYRIIKDHDGEIEVESSPGQGTIFRILIPVNSDLGEKGAR
jgi:PAS domain S-box-containing protein